LSAGSALVDGGNLDDLLHGGDNFDGVSIYRAAVHVSSRRKNGDLLSGKSMCALVEKWDLL
jgi:hypothetical protein